MCFLPVIIEPVTNLRSFVRNMKLSKILSFGILALSFAGAYAQPAGYEIEVTMKGLRDTTCILGHYNLKGNSFVSKDTARADAHGKMVFKGDSLPGGIYLVVLPGNSKWAELIYSGKETHFSLSTDTTDIITAMTVSGSEENQFYYGFLQTMETKMQELAKVSKTNPNSSEAAKIRKEIEEYRKGLISKRPDLLTSKFLQAVQAIDIPPAPKLPNGRDDSTWVFNYYKNHYWDNLDLNDDRMLRTPILQAKMDQYVQNLVVQQVDSLIKEADALIARSHNRDFRQFLIRYFASEYENPKTVGTEGVFVHMAEKYYLSGEMSLSDDGRKRISERVKVLKPLLVSKPFPALTLWDPQKAPFSLKDVPADYTVVFFYSPTCGHCKDSAPALMSFYEKNKAQGVKVIAVATENSDEEWKKFIENQKTAALQNGYDYSGQIDFRNQFDVLSTPTIYILDKQKRIIARKMPVEQLDDFLGFYRRKTGVK